MLALLMACVLLDIFVARRLHRVEAVARSSQAEDLEAASM
jgi:hypothetical protein